MRSMRKILSVVLVLVLAMGLFVGCGQTKSATTTADASATDAAAAAAPATEAAAASTAQASTSNLDIPAVPDLNGMTSLEWLLSREDKLPLGGIAPDTLESRADVYKGLDKIDYNDKDVVIGWLDVSQGAPWFIEVNQSAKARAEKYGYKIVSFDANFDLTTQTEQVENCLNQDIDFLVIDTVDIDALSLYFKEAADLGIPVIAKGATPAQDDYNIITCVISNCWEAGYVNGVYAAEQTFGNYSEPAKLGILINRLDGFGESRSCGFICGYIEKFAELAGQPYDSKWDATVVGYNAWLQLRDTGSYKVGDVIDLVGYVTTSNVATSSAQPACAELLTAHPDLDFALVETDSMGLSMVSEIQQMGLVPGKDILVCYVSDGLNTICEAIQDGSVLSMGSNSPYPCGEGIVDFIHDIMNGKDVNDLPANTYVPTYCINKDTLSKVWTGPDQVYAKMLGDFNIQTVEEYNAAHAK